MTNKEFAEKEKELQRRIKKINEALMKEYSEYVKVHDNLELEMRYENNMLGVMLPDFQSFIFSKAYSKYEHYLLLGKVLDRALEVIQKLKRGQLRMPRNLSGYLMTAARNTVTDYQRKMARKNEIQAILNGETETGELKHIKRVRRADLDRWRVKYTVSFESVIQDEEGEEVGLMIDTIPDPGPSVEELVMMDGTPHEFFHKALFFYCTALTTLKKPFEQPLAVYYARVLPHEKSRIPDTKAISTTWAIDYMGKRTIRTLASKAQKMLRKAVDDTISWSPYHTEQLNKPTMHASSSGKYGDIIYTETFSQAQMQNWAADCHTSIVRECRKLAIRDVVFKRQSREYMTSREKTLNVFYFEEGADK